MTDAERFRMKPYIQPFERALAIEELERLTNSPAVPEGKSHVGDYMARGRKAPASVAAKLAYWEAVGDARAPTAQVLREASVSIARNGVALRDIPSLSKAAVSAKIPRKRSLRYGTHGIHEYRGKFFPQLVRALVNISGIRTGSTILDPMCGSGTTVVEAITDGHNGVGFDMNPLSVFVSEVKCLLLLSSPLELIHAFEELDEALSGRRPALALERDERDAAYLRAWFASNMLAELAVIEAAIDCVTSAIARDFYRVALSNVLRSLSYQKLADLRVRREHKDFVSGAALAAFRAEALRSTKSVVAFLAHGQVDRVGTHRVRSADARSFVENGHVHEGSVDLVVTSPPYATALPYLDTDRLSLIFLGLLPRANHSAHDKQMIGNREVTDRGRRELWAEYEAQQTCLPMEVQDLVARIHHENGKATVGFRRRNLPALLGRYFMDMRDVLMETFRALRPGGSAFFVVGNNRTNTPNGEIVIETAQLLGKMAEAVGFEAADAMSMEMLSSRDLFSKNQTPSEHIIRLTKSEIAEAAR